MSTEDWDDIRALFPATRELAYLNTATYGPGPTPVLEAVTAALGDWSRGEGDWRVWERDAEAARAGFAACVGAAPEAVALLPAVSLAAAQVAASLVPPPRGRATVLVGENEFRSNLYPWLALEERGFDVRLLPAREGRVPPETYVEAIDERCALVALSSVQSANGYRTPLEPLVEACRNSGAHLFVDGTQSVGALRLDLDGIDYLAVSGYKWLCAPRGTAYLYVAPRHLEAMRPLAPGWKSPADPHAEYYGPPLEFATNASRLDVSLAWASWVGARAALELIGRIGIERIEARDLELADGFRSGLAELELRPLFSPRESSQIVAVAIPEPDLVAESLRASGVITAVRHGTLRASFHFFNDESDVERALAVLARSLANA